MRALLVVMAAGALAAITVVVVLVHVLAITQVGVGI